MTHNPPCITKFLMSLCLFQFEAMRDFWTDTRTQVKPKLVKFCSSEQSFSAAQWLKFGDTGRQIFTIGR